jgi:hypothetical protein
VTKVYKYRVYDITIDDYRLSTRMATKEHIARIGGDLIPGTEREIDPVLLRDGWTEKNFDPDRPIQTPEQRRREEAAAATPTFEDS